MRTWRGEGDMIQRETSVRAWGSAERHLCAQQGRRAPSARGSGARMEGDCTTPSTSELVLCVPQNPWGPTPFCQR